MALPEMTPVQSSNLVAAGVDGDDLLVTFHHGGTYRYKNAAAEYDALVSSGSVGQYFHDNIKGGYTTERVG